jgi:hypothetical protein
MTTRITSQQGSYSSAWVLSFAGHAIIVLFIWASSLRLSKRSGGDEGLVVNTTLAESKEFGESLLDIQIPISQPIKQEASLPPIEPPQPTEIKSSTNQSSTTQAPTSNQSQTISSNPSLGSTNGSHSATPNSGKGSPLHPTVLAGNSIVYVLDCSSSMGRGNKLREAIATLESSLKQLTSEVHFQIVLYHSQAEKMTIGGSTDLVPASEENIRSVVESLSRLKAEGTSKHLEGIKTAFRLEPSVIFLLTDADDLSEDQLLTIGLLNRKKTVIYPVLFGNEARLIRSSAFQKLAEKNRGEVISRGY